ncbi:MAG: AAA family ATPase, partial [Methanolinea sp.]
FQRSYEELGEGDTLLAYYPDPVKRYKAILRCIKKREDALLLEYVRDWEGPTFKEMKEDPVMRDLPMVRGLMIFSLKLLEQPELERLMALSPSLTSSALGLSETTIHEKVPATHTVTFHPSFGYEEFVEGLRPETDEEGTLRFAVAEGIFKRFCRDACNALLQKAGIGKTWTEGQGIPDLEHDEKARVRDIAPRVPFVMIIDEINRGDIPRIFGELITLLEADKRYAMENEVVTVLPYSKQPFAVPPNLLLVGTMNTADRSIALIDVALRRRFGFVEVMPDYALLRETFSNLPEDARSVADIAVRALEGLNQKITALYDRDHQVGHSYFLPLSGCGSREEATRALRIAWYHDIVPLLQEYFYDSGERLREVLGDAFVRADGDRFIDIATDLDDRAFLDALERIALPAGGQPSTGPDGDGNVP